MKVYVGLFCNIMSSTITVFGWVAHKIRPSSNKDNDAIET